MEIWETKKRFGIKLIEIEVRESIKEVKWERAIKYIFV